MTKSHKHKIDFAFLVHPRDIRDVWNKYPITRLIPKKVIMKLLPFVGPLNVGSIKGPISQKTGERVWGVVISVPLLAEQILVDREQAVVAVRKAIQFSKKLGAHYIGLGSLTSPVVDGGTLVADDVDVYITNGNALTVAMTIEGIRKVAITRLVTLRDSTVAIVGATGSIGSAVAQILANEDRPQKLVLIGRTKDNLISLHKKMGSLQNVQIATNLSLLAKADIVVVATSASGAIISPEMLKRDAIVYDITQPQNVSVDVQKKRPDVLIVDGGIVKLPDDVSVRVQMGLPQGTTFACLTETMLIAAENYKKNFSIGDVQLDQVTYISNVAEKYAFELAPLYSWGELI